MMMGSTRRVARIVVILLSIVAVIVMSGWLHTLLITQPKAVSMTPPTLVWLMKVAAIVPLLSAAIACSLGVKV